ncbi:MAG: oxaloacetate decarboxylase [Gemmiger sp.]
MLDLNSWMVTLPVLLAGMAGVFVVMGALTVAVLVLNHFTGKKGK